MFWIYNFSEIDDVIYYVVVIYEVSGIGEVIGLEGDKVEVFVEDFSGWWMV